MSQAGAGVAFLEQSGVELLCETLGAEQRQPPAVRLQDAGSRGLKPLRRDGAKRTKRVAIGAVEFRQTKPEDTEGWVLERAPQRPLDRSADPRQALRGGTGAS